MRGHMLEVELITLDPKTFDNLQYFFTKYKDLLSELKACRVDKYKEEKQMVLTVLSKVFLKYSVFVSTFHSVRLASGATWTIPFVEAFTKSLTQEKNKLINMGKIKGPKVHALTMQDCSSHQYHKSKDKEKRKAHENPKKEGYSKPFNDASVSKVRKGRKWEKWTYCHK
jgi:ATP sulfurylase